MTITRKLVKFLLSSSSSSSSSSLYRSPQKLRILRNPHFFTSSLYSTTTRTKNQPKPKPPPPKQPPFSPSPPQDTVSGGDLDWPRPSEIPFQVKVANKVNLIGYIQMPVQCKASSDGTFWAGTMITQKATCRSPLLWIPLIFEGDLAHIAACHLKENDHVCITGQLSTDPLPLPINQTQANVQVQVGSINFVQKSRTEESPVMEKNSITKIEKKSTLTYSVGVTYDQKSVLASWKDLLENPNEWRDYRPKKQSRMLTPRHPDFKRKNSNVPLWLNKAPEQVLAQLDGLEFDCQLPDTKRVDTKENKDDKWKDLVENPSKWWDNRVDKLNAKYPDFKHKETRDGLWLAGSPAWVLPKLPPVKPSKKDSTEKWDTMLS